MQLDKQVYEYTGEDFDPKNELQLDQYYGGQDLVDADNLTAALSTLFDNSSAIAQVLKNETVQANVTANVSASNATSLVNKNSTKMVSLDKP